MDFLTEVIAACQRGLLAVAATPLGLPGSLFLAGLAGSLLHCAGMCGPFVLGQVMIDAESSKSSGYSEWRRLSGAALIPYHLGRITTYTGLGAAAGIATAAFATASMFSWLSSALLVVAAALMIAQAFGMALGATSPLSSSLARLAAPLSSSRRPMARYALGVVLGFLPCGLLYGALAAAGGTASLRDGAFAMAAFALGTIPALITIGWGGLIVRRHLQDVARWISAPLLLANAALMLVLAASRL